MKTSLMTKPTDPMIAKPTAQDAAILRNSKVKSPSTLSVWFIALLEELDRVFVEVDEVLLDVLDEFSHLCVFINNADPVN